MTDPNTQLAALETKRGSYRLVIRATKTAINPNETVTVQLYISGYGTIDYPKLVFYPSADVLSKESEVLFDIAKHENGRYYFGAHKEKLDEYGKTIDLAFINGRTLFLPDPESTTRQIITEKNTKGIAPVQLEISSRGRPGNYSIHFVLTYFDGEEWTNVSEKFQFTIRNLLQRYESLAWWLGLMAAAGTILAGIATTWNFIGPTLLRWLAC